MVAFPLRSLCVLYIGTTTRRHFSTVFRDNRLAPFLKSKMSSRYLLLRIPFRRLQMIIIRPPDDSSGNDSEYSYVNIQSEGSGRRPTTAIICNRIDADDVTRTDISYFYKVELNDPELDLPSTFVETDLPPLVDGASVEAIADLLCDLHTTRRRKLGPDDYNPTRRRATELDKIAGCIVSVSTCSPDQAIGFCEPSSGDRSCFENEGDIRVVHTADCDSEEIQAAGLTALRASMPTSRYLDPINGRITEGTTQVLLVSIIDRDAGPGMVSSINDGYEEPQDTQLSAAAIFFVVFAVSLLLALLLFLCCWRHRVLAQQRQLDDDLRSIKTDWSGEDGRFNKKFHPADFHNLSMKPVNVDVHKCASGICAVCYPNGVKRGDVMFTPVTCKAVGGKMPVRVNNHPDDDNDWDTFEDEPYNEQGAKSPRRIPTPPGGRRANSPPNAFSDDERVNFVRVDNPRRATNGNNYKYGQAKSNSMVL
jgi:hypothetical protein